MCVIIPAIIILLWNCRLVHLDYIRVEKNFNELLVDISEDCEGNYSTSLHLPYGFGPADARVILLRSVASLVRNCSVVVVGPHLDNTCGEKCMTVMVAEFFNYNSSCDDMDGGILVSNSDDTFGVCTNLDGQYIMKDRYDYEMYSYLVYSRRSVITINFKNYSGAIKITLTAGRLTPSDSLCNPTKIGCTLLGKEFCIDKALQCDGNFNCGTPDLFDEYCYNVNVEENILLTMAYGVGLVIIVIFFLVQLLKIYVPTVADRFFIFNDTEDNTFVLTSQSLPPLRNETDNTS